MRRILLSLALAACAALVAAPATAQEAGVYDYAEARVTLLGDRTNGDSDDVNGLGLEGSTSFGDLVFARAAVELLDVDEPGADDAVDLFSVGPGVRIPLTTDLPVDLWAALNYERVSTGRVATGFGLDVGVTVLFNERLRGGFMVKSTDTDAGGDDVDYELWELEVGYTLDNGLELVGSLVNADFDVEGRRGDFDLDDLIRIGVRMPF